MTDKNDGRLDALALPRLCAASIRRSYLWEYPDKRFYQSSALLSGFFELSVSSNTEVYVAKVCNPITDPLVFFVFRTPEGDSCFKRLIVWTETHIGLIFQAHGGAAWP